MKQKLKEVRNHPIVLQENKNHFFKSVKQQQSQNSSTMTLTLKPLLHKYSDLLKRAQYHISVIRNPSTRGGKGRKFGQTSQGYVASVCFQRKAVSKPKKSFTMLQTLLEISNGIPSRYENNIVRENETIEHQSMDFLKAATYYLPSCP